VSRSVRDNVETLYQLIRPEIQLEFYESYVRFSRTFAPIAHCSKKPHCFNYLKVSRFLFYTMSYLSAKQGRPFCLEKICFYLHFVLTCISLELIFRRLYIFFLFTQYFTVYRGIIVCKQEKICSRRKHTF
jgi:hypothetical protein